MKLMVNPLPAPPSDLEACLVHVAIDEDQLPDGCGLGKKIA